jgi:hypothetical protein
MSACVATVLAVASRRLRCAKPVTGIRIQTAVFAASSGEECLTLLTRITLRVILLARTPLLIVVLVASRYSSMA